MPHRRFIGLVVCVLAGWVAAPVQAAGAGEPLDRFRDRVRFSSAHQALAGAGALPAVLDAQAAPDATLRLYRLKRERSRFAGAFGPLVAPVGDVPVGADARADENEPTVAADPRRDDRLVAGSHSLDPVAAVNRCVAYASDDGGRRWSPPVVMPQLTPASTCADPVLAYAPDGERVHYAYMDIKISDVVGPGTVTIARDFDILVSTSRDGGRRWSAPVVALDGDRSSITIDLGTGEVVVAEPGFDFDKPWIATHVPSGKHGRRHAERGSVYVTATRLDNGTPGLACRIAFARSADRAVHWSAPVQLDTSGGDCGAPVLVQGSRPSGGPGRDVVVAWYHSGADGVYEGSFEIRAAASSDGGRRFGAPVTVVRDRFETPFFLGPFAFYHRWAGSMFPDVELAADGRAHIAYTHDPAENGLTFVDPDTGEQIVLPDVSTTAEDGDIRYVRSEPRRYGAGAWSAPVTVNDDGLVRAQGYPALETGARREDEDRSGGYADVRIIWEDHRLSPEVPVTDPEDPAQFQQSSNRFYDVFASRRDAGGTWGRNVRVTDRSSISDFLFNGDYFDLAVSEEDRFFGIWTDRRHQTSTGATATPTGGIVIDEAALEDNVFGARLAHGDDDD